MSLRLTLVVLLTVFPALPVAAQTREAAVGDERALDRVRVKLVDEPGDVRGRFVALDMDVVTVLVEGQQVRIPLARVRRVEGNAAVGAL